MARSKRLGGTRPTILYTSYFRGAVEAVARRRRAFESFSSAAVREMKEHSTAKPSLRRYLAEIGTNHLEGKAHLLIQ